jgi:hypothetical protein
MTWGLIGLGMVRYMLRSPRFYETVAVTAIAIGSLRQIGQQNAAGMTARLAAWNKREMQRLERKAQRQARAIKGSAQMARSGRGIHCRRAHGQLGGYQVGRRRECSSCCTSRWPSWPGSLAACSAG